MCIRLSDEKKPNELTCDYDDYFTAEQSRIFHIPSFFRICCAIENDFVIAK